MYLAREVDPAVPKHKSLTISAEVVPAGRKRKCYHAQKHVIVKGDLCLEVKDGMALKGYCVPCAIAMIEAARSRLDEFRSALKA
jgi:hypothetical protein